MNKLKDSAKIVCYHEDNEHFVIIIVGSIGGNFVFEKQAYTKSFTWYAATKSENPMFTKKDLDESKKLFNAWKTGELIDTRKCKNCKYKYKCITNNFSFVGENG